MDHGSPGIERRCSAVQGCTTCTVLHIQYSDAACCGVIQLHRADGGIKSSRKEGEAGMRRGGRGLSANKAFQGTICDLQRWRNQLDELFPPGFSAQYSTAGSLNSIIELSHQRARAPGMLSKKCEPRAAMERLRTWKTWFCSSGSTKPHAVLCCTVPYSAAAEKLAVVGCYGARGCCAETSRGREESGNNNFTNLDRSTPIDNCCCQRDLT